MASTIKVNLLPHETARFRLDPQSVVLFCLVAMASLGFATYSQNLRVRIQDKNRAVHLLDDQVKEAQSSLPLIEARKSRTAQIKAQLKLIHSLSKDPLRYAALLRELAGLLPPNIWLSSLSVDPGAQTIALSGTASGTAGRLPLATVSRFMERLNQSPYFKDANLASTSRGHQDDFAFQLQVHYDRESIPDTAELNSRATRK